MIDYGKKQREKGKTGVAIMQVFIIYIRFCFTIVLIVVKYIS